MTLVTSDWWLVEARTGEEEEFYRLPLNNKTGHVVTPKVLLVQQRRFLACFPSHIRVSRAHLLVMH